MEQTAVSMLFEVHIHSSLTFDCMSFWFDDEIRLEIFAAMNKRNQKCGTISTDALSLITCKCLSQDSASTWNCCRTLLKCDGLEHQKLSTCDAARGVISRNQERVISNVWVIRMENVSCRVKCHRRCLYIWVIVKTLWYQLIVDSPLCLNCQQNKFWSRNFNLKQKFSHWNKSDSKKIIKVMNEHETDVNILSLMHEPSRVRIMKTNWIITAKLRYKYSARAADERENSFKESCDNFKSPANEIYCSWNELMKIINLNELFGADLNWKLAEDSLKINLWKLLFWLKLLFSIFINFNYREHFFGFRAQT